MTTERQLTIGERLAGVSFNPSSLTAVDVVKRSFAKIIDDLDDMRAPILNKAPTDDEDDLQLTMINRAINECVTAQMWAVKAITWRIKPTVSLPSNKGDL